MTLDTARLEHFLDGADLDGILVDDDGDAAGAEPHERGRAQNG
jgi:hypothetical protein